MKFPNGVPLKPVDLTDEAYNKDDLTKKKLWGIEDFDKPKAPLSKKEFLN